MEMFGYKSFWKRTGIADFLSTFLLSRHVSSARALCSPSQKLLSKLRGHSPHDTWATPCTVFHIDLMTDQCHHLIPLHNLWTSSANSQTASKNVPSFLSWYWVWFRVIWVATLKMSLRSNMQFCLGQGRRFCFVIQVQMKIVRFH